MQDLIVLFEDFFGFSTAISGRSSTTVELRLNDVLVVLIALEHAKLARDFVIVGTVAMVSCDSLSNQSVNISILLIENDEE
jgi:hypothetical protein